MLRHESTLPVLARHVSLHIAGNHGLLLDARKQLLYSATPVDTLLMCCLVEGMPESNILDLLGHRLAVPRDEAMRRLTAGISVWREAGLLDDADIRERTAVVDRPNGQRIITPEEPAVDGESRSAFAPAAMGGPYRMVDTAFTVGFDDATIFEQTQVAIRNLETPVRLLEPLLIEVESERNGFAAFFGGQPQARCDSRDQVSLMLLAVMSRIAVHRCDALCAIHAGAVRLKSGCALLPGPAGVGKSTLVAGLAAAGFRAMCDDTTLLTGNNLTARPVSTGVWIKRGSWPVVAPRFPDHEPTPERLRPDGKHVRLLAIGDDPAADNGKGVAVSRIIFPCFDPTAHPATDALDSASALKQLVANVYLLANKLDAESIERLIEWISAIPCYRIRYPSLDSAVDQVCSVVR